MALRIIDDLNVRLFDTIAAVSIGRQKAALLDGQGRSLLLNPTGLPQVIGRIANVVEVVGAKAITINLATRFSGASSYAISPASTPGVTLAGATLTIAPTAVLAQCVITVTGLNAAGTSAPLSFSLTVHPAAPTVTAPLPDQNLVVGASTVTIDLSQRFANAATYAVSPAGQGVTIAGSVLSISTAVPRSATYTVTATGVAGQSVTAAFNLVVALPMTAPSITVPPTISGGTVVGVLLTSNIGQAAGNPAPTATRQWLSDGAVIAGATGASFDTTGFAGRSISLRVTWSNGIGSPAVATTAPTLITPAAIAPAFGTGGTLAVSGSDIVLTPPPVTTGIPAPAVSVVATRNGSLVTVANGRIVGGAIPGTVDHIFAVRWTAANGTLPDATREARLTVPASTVKPLDGGLLDLTQPISTTATDGWIQTSMAPLVLNTGAAPNVLTRRGGWSFPSVNGAKYLAQIRFGVPLTGFNSGAALRASRTALFDFKGPSLIAQHPLTTAPDADGVYSIAFTGTGGQVWIGVSLGFPASELNKPLPITMLRVERTDLLAGPDLPRVTDTIADVNTVVGASAVTIDLATKFSGATSYAISPADIPGVTLAGAILTINPTAVVAQRTLAVTGINATGASAPLSFGLRIDAVPAVTAPLPDQSLIVGDTNVTIDLASRFSNAATYTISPPGQVVAISGNVLTITPAVVGNATYTVTATSSTGQSVSQSFTLSVGGQPNKTCAVDDTSTGFVIQG